jgi:hypothetical protein
MGVSVAMGIKHVVIAAGLAAGLTSPAFAQPCIRPAERTAVDFRAVQSQLMVAAIACGRTEEYNTFVRRHQGELGAAHRTVSGVFRRAHGAQGQRQYDQYITNLANAQSQEGIRQGSHFCRDIGVLFQAALAAPNGGAVAALSAQHRVANPMPIADCPATQQAAAPAERTRTAQVQPQPRPTAQR